MSFLDFNEIKSANAIDEVAHRLGIQLTKSGSSLRGKCLKCVSSGDRNIAITPSKGVYYCFSDGDGKGGDVIALVAHTLGIGTKDAAAWLAGPTTTKEKATKAEAPSEGGFKALEYLQHDHEAVLALGFEPDDAERLGIGFAPRGILKGKVAIPVRLANGKLAGYVGLTDCQLPPKWSW